MSRIKSCLLPFILVCLSAAVVIAEDAPKAQKKAEKKQDKLAIVIQPADNNPKKSDVSFSSRWKHPQNASDSYDTFVMARTFFATRIDWLYSYDPVFIGALKEQGWPVSTALNLTLPDDDTEPPTYLKGRIEDRHGKLVSPPWMTWEPKPTCGCANSPEYRDNVLQRSIRLIDAGSTAIQFDDPSMNEGAVIWGGGGCFCKHCIKRFPNYLSSKLSEKELEDLGADTYEPFSYKDYVNAGGVSEVLKTHWVEFQKQSVRNFFTWLRRTLNEKYGRVIPFSSNNYDIRWKTPFDLFDYGMCEIPARSFSPDIIFDRIEEATKLGRRQIVTIHSDDPLVNRKCVGTIYASGGNPIVPWDVWIKNQDRYYGTPEDHADQFGFVRAIPHYFDGFDTLAAGGKGKANDQLSSDNPDIFAVARINKDTGAVVIHLIDWSDANKPFTLTVANALMPKKYKTVKLLTPAKYDTKVAEAAIASGDFAKLAISAKVKVKKDKNVIRITVPAITPWATLVIE